MANPTAKTIYYLPGYGGQLGTGLGRALMDRGFDVAGRETRGNFRSLPFDEQIATVGQDLKDHFWHADARVICNSFGAYLFFHAQTQMPSFPGRVLLLSPIVGEFTNAEARTSFSPPRPTRLKDLAEAGQFTVPRPRAVRSRSRSRSPPRACSLCKRRVPSPRPVTRSLWCSLPWP